MTVNLEGGHGNSNAENRSTFRIFVKHNSWTQNLVIHFHGMVGTLPKTNIAMENPPF